MKASTLKSYQFNEDQILTDEQKKWCKKLEKLLISMPEGIELILGEQLINVMQEGFYSGGGLDDEYGNSVDMLSKGGNLIHEQSMREITVNRFYPNSESI